MLEVKNLTDYLSQTQFDYLIDTVEEISKKYSVSKYDVKLKSNGLKIEIKFDLDLMQTINVKDQTSLLQIQLRMVDSVDNKIALKIHPFVYIPFNQTYHCLDLNRKLKLTHRGTNFDNNQKITMFLNTLPSEKELRTLLSNFNTKYQKIKNSNITLNEVDDILNNITDTFFRNTFERKLRCSKYFSIKREVEEVVTANGVEVIEADSTFSLENIYNCWFECVRSGSLDSLQRNQTTFERICGKYIK